MVWIFREGDLDWHRGTHGTHEIMYGPTYVDHWRGRIDLPTRVCSVKAPNGSKELTCPDWLQKALVASFGEKTKIVNFGTGDWSIDKEA